jgi:hypothetical protein
MKYIITENRLSMLVVKFINSTYGELNQVYKKNKDKYEWYKDGEKFNNRHFIFEMNSSGTLLIPYSLLQNLSHFLGIDNSEDFDKAMISAWEYMFGITPKRVYTYFD